MLRYLEGDGPAAGVDAELHDSELPLMSWINLGEVPYVLQRSHGEAAALAIAERADLWTDDPELLVVGSTWRW